MHFLIEHNTSYKYSTSVFLEPHYLYFYPSHRPYVQVVEYDLQISPSPQRCPARLDAENNIYHQCWYLEKISELQIVMKATIKTKPFNPFDFLVEESVKPFEHEALKIYLSNQITLSDDVWSWIKKIRKNDEDETTIVFLQNICQQIGQEWEYAIRYGAHLLDPNHCFMDKKGSCRDLSWMMIHMLRNQGFPARFVSGYCYNPELTGHELHAWVEAWVGSAGWIGFDPSTGLLTTEQYIPVACSYLPGNTLPVQGAFRGSSAANLGTSVNIKLLEMD